MSIVSSLYTGASGLQTMGNAMQVTGNNIANVNTVGFKSSRAEFVEILSQSLSGGGSGQIGRGVTLGGITGVFSQGSFQNTARVTDLAVSGNGFFILNDGEADVYTRAGQFSIDRDGNLVSIDDLRVQGFQFDLNGDNTGVLGDINLANLTSPPKVTEEVTISANLDSEAEIVGPFDINDPANTSNFSTALTIHDSLGAPHVLTVFFEKTSDLNWNWHATVDGGEIVGGTQGQPTEIFGGTLTFNPDGSLNAVTQDTATFSDVDFVGGAAADQVIDFNFGEPTSTGGSGLDGMTQFAGPQVTNFQAQDGFSQGSLQGIDVNEAGIITGIFSNGRTRPVGQVALANFQNSQGLLRIGDNNFRETIFSGVPTVGEPTAGALGAIASQSLELSNVDLTTEFIQMITNQRGFQANSRVVSVGDELLEQVVNLT